MKSSNWIILISLGSSVSAEAHLGPGGDDADVLLPVVRKWSEVQKASSNPRDSKDEDCDHLPVASANESAAHANPALKRRKLDVSELAREIKDKTARLGCQIYDSYPNVEKPLGGRLTPFWAQEYVGADLARQFVKEHSASLASQRVPVAILDMGFDSKSLPKGRVDPDILNGSKDLQSPTATDNAHGTTDSHLLAGSTLSSTSDVTFLNYVERFTDHSHLSVLGKIAQDPPKIVSVAPLSMRDLTVIPSFAPATQKTIFLAAAGNHYPLIDEGQTRLSQMAFLVGSLSPLGFMSASSSSSPGVLDRGSG